MSEATLVYDDDCGFCTWCAVQAADHSTVELVGFSELTDEQRERLPDDYETCAHLLVDDSVYSCGEAVEEGFARTELGSELRPVVDFLRQFEDYTALRERGYRAVADRRDVFGKYLSMDPPARSE